MTRVLIDRTLRTLGILAYRCGLRRLVMWLNRGAPKVLLYHACQEREDAYIAGLGANTTPDVFALHMAYVRRHYRVIPLEDLEHGPVPDYAAVITFDDGYYSVYQHAFPVLRSLGMPATVYLVTDVVGSGRLVWVNELNWYLRHHAHVAQPLAREVLGCAPDATPESLIESARVNYDRAVIQGLLERLRAVAGPPPADDRVYLDWREAREMAASGITFGSHTASHPTLTRLDAAALRTEMDRARARFAECLVPTTSLAYPFGSRSALVAEIARQAGHTSLMEVGGSNRPLDLMRVGRVPVTARSEAELFAELEVAGPVRGWIRRRLGR